MGDENLDNNMYNFTINYLNDCFDGGGGGLGFLGPRFGPCDPFAAAGRRLPDYSIFRSSGLGGLINGYGRDRFGPRYGNIFGGFGRGGFCNPCDPYYGGGGRPGRNSKWGKILTGISLGTGILGGILGGRSCF